MAEAAAWKARLRHRVASSERNSESTGKHMVDVFHLLQAGAAEGTAAGALHCIYLALASLKLATGAVGTAAAARHGIDLAIDSLKLAAGAAEGAEGTAAAARHGIDLALDSLKLAMGAEGTEASARHCIDLAVDSLKLAAGAAEGTAARARHGIDLALNSLNLAAGAASLAAADMLAARLAGLRGASPNPAQPLSSVDEIADTEVRTALQALSAAYEEADQAFHLIKVCSAHLLTVRSLARYDGMDDLLASERELATTAFARASQMVQGFLGKADYAYGVLSAHGAADP